MSVKWQNGVLTYVYTLPNGSTATLSDNKILHIPGFGFDGLIGYDPITLAREAIGLSKATEEFGARFFSGGSQLSGVLTHPGQLKETARDNMRKSWEEMHQGLSNQHRVAILEEGVSFQSIGVPPENAQFLETREFQVTEIARFLHIPPHMIGDLKHATFSNIEHQGIEFVIYTMTPWFARWEQTINRKLITLADKKDYFSEFMVAGLMRGDSQARASYYKEMFYMGAMSPNDIRAKENENPITGGDTYYVPLNMLPAGSPASEGVKSYETKAKRAGLIRSRTAQAYKELFIDVGERITKEEIKRLREKAQEYLPARKKITKKAKTEWFDWLDEFYGEFHDDIKMMILPPSASLADEIQALALEEINSDRREDLSKFLDSYAEAFTARYIDSSTGQLKYIGQEDDPLAITETRLDEWEKTRPGKVGMNETVQLSNAVAKVVFAGAGIMRLRWVAIGSKSCPLCQEMDGKVVGIEQNFLDRGDRLSAEDTSDLQVYRPTSHPPLHQGCYISLHG
jgi:HK97 family phage portal protein